MNETIVVAGATGYLGRHIIASLDARGYRVRALVRGGVVEVPELMRRLRALEAPMHGAWYGDVVVARLRDAAVADLA